jgi:hypothetical protein
MYEAQWPAWPKTQILLPIDLQATQGTITRGSLARQVTCEIMRFFKVDEF